MPQLWYHHIKQGKEKVSRADMNEKSKELYGLMLKKGYPEEFSRLICLEMNTEFTAEKMLH